MRPPDARVSRYIAMLPGGKRARIGVAILIAAMALLALIALELSNGSPKPLVAQEGDSPFYIEASIVVLGVVPAGETMRPEESKSTMQWWYLRPGVWHWQIDYEPKDAEPITILSIADGKDAYLYFSDTNTYTKTTVKNFVATNLPVSAILGSVDVNQLMVDWEAANTSVRSSGASTYSGRPAQVMEYSPTWRSSGAGGNRQGGLGRIWIDDDTGLVLRNLVDGGSTSEYVDARVTLLDLQPKFDSETFKFNPPNGAKPAESN